MSAWPANSLTSWKGQSQRTSREWLSPLSRWEQQASRNAAIRPEISFRCGGVAADSAEHRCDCAPLRGVNDPRATREGSSVRPLGCRTYLDAKAKGETSMFEKA